MKYMVGEDGFPQNSNMAAKLLKEAAEKGHANAQFNLAVCFARGIGVNMDHGQTLIWLEKAAANGHPQAKEFLEELKRDGGLEAPADLKEVTEAAEKGDAEAQCKLAMIYYMGQGVPRDLDKMIYWLEKSAGQGFAEAQFRLGCAYNDGTGVPQDEKKAAELFAKSAEQGYADGQYGLGLCYEKGEGVPKDEEQAIKWYTLAGEQGVAEAQYNLAAIYYRQGSDKEIYWLAKAADQGEIDPATGYRLALHYL
ncbi:sel1 repeat family protein, partial [bacterium]|nr:sel1 repeat family protein [bacterium]